MDKALTSYSDKIWAWERFLMGEQDAAILLGGMVVSSWQRSLSLGVNPTGRVAPIAASGDEFLRIKHSNHELITAASGLMAHMQGVFAESGCIMLVTDPTGVVLEAVGDHKVLAAGERIHLVAGGKWNEGTIGTNGIGTVLATGQPTQVHAAEHFCEGIKGWTCAGAPIRQPGTGKILGVVDISGPPSTYQRGNLALAMAIAGQIETALAVQAGWERSRLLEHCMHRIPAAGTAGMLLLDRAGRIVFADRQADLPYAAGGAMPGFDPDEPVESWVNRLPAHMRVGVDIDPIRIDGRMAGALIVMPRAKPPASVEGLKRAVDQDHFSGIVGASPATGRMVARARQLAARRVALLIQGETGVGKEILVRAIQAENGLASPFVVFNCGTASKELLAAELFGHVRGAFTGALHEGRAGRFELAHGGILCLDEIGELPLEMQPLLLRVLEDGMVYRVGDTTPRQIDVRLIAMTNRNLRHEVAAGRFRADLFHRINVTCIEIPALRERSGDVALLLEHFNRLLADKHKLPPLRFDPEALAALEAYSWPGNVRELRNVVESLLLSGSEGIVLRADLPADVIDAEAEPRSESGMPSSLDDLSRLTIRRTLQSSGGNISEAARRLGIARSTLHRKITRKDGS